MAANLMLREGSAYQRSLIPLPWRTRRRRQRRNSPSLAPLAASLCDTYYIYIIYIYIYIKSHIYHIYIREIFTSFPPPPLREPEAILAKRNVHLPLPPPPPPLSLFMVLWFYIIITYMGIEMERI